MDRFFCVTDIELVEEMIKDYVDYHFEPRVDNNFRAKGWASLVDRVEISVCKASLQWLLCMGGLCEHKIRCI